MSVPREKSSGMVPHKHPAAGRGSTPADSMSYENIAALERERIDALKSYIEVEKESVAANERNEQRQLESNMRRFELQMEFNRARHKTFKTFAYYVGGFLGAAVGGFLLYNAFYGDEAQKEYALMIIKYLFIGIAGYGVISSIAGLFRKFLKQDSDE